MNQICPWLHRNSIFEVVNRESGDESLNSDDEQRSTYDRSDQANGHFQGRSFFLLIAACAVDAYLLSVLASDYFERGVLTSGVFAFLAFSLLGFLMISVIKLGRQLLDEKFRKPEAEKGNEIVKGPETSETARQDQTFVFIKAGNKIYKVSFDAVLYAEASGNHTKIVLEDNVIQPAMTFTSVEGLLPARLFARLHRSFMVNTTKITHIEGNRVFIGN